MALTSLAVAKAKAVDRPQRLFDGAGMYLEISPSGGKLWRLKYRFRGKEKRLALGKYPDVSLAKARERRDDARRLLADGIDPGEHKKTAKNMREGLAKNTFEPRSYLSGRASCVMPNCQRRAATLYIMRGALRCPKCGRLSYASQRGDAIDRAWIKQWKIQARLVNGWGKPNACAGKLSSVCRR